MILTPAQFGLAASLFYGKPELQEQYAAIAKAVNKLNDLGDPWTSDVAYEFVQLSGVAKDVSKDEAKYLCQKLSWYIQGKV